MSRSRRCQVSTQGLPKSGSGLQRTVLFSAAARTPTLLALQPSLVPPAAWILNRSGATETTSSTTSDRGANTRTKSHGVFVFGFRIALTLTDFECAEPVRACVRASSCEPHCLDRAFGAVYCFSVQHDGGQRTRTCALTAAAVVSWVAVARVMVKTPSHLVSSCWSDQFRCLEGGYAAWCACCWGHV